MIRRSFRRGLWLGLIAGAVAAVAKVVQRQAAPPDIRVETYRPDAAAAPVVELPKKPKATASPSVDPVDGQCPDSHPIKAKLSSGLFHVPGGLAYARTKADRCYIDAAAAEADGLTQSKR